MDDLLLHPSTRHAIEQALGGSHHAIGLIGPYGAGKGHLARKIAIRFLGEKHKEHNILHVIPKDQSIGIEEIRALQQFTRLKTPGKNDIRRVIVIEDAGLMTIEAQNSLLKTLEEPPDDTRIILTINDTTSLRKTIYSRLQLIHIKPCSLEDAEGFFKDYEKLDINKAYIVSGGYIGLCSALLGDKDHALTQAIVSAKQFISSTSYHRLMQVDGLAKDKEKIALLLFAMKRVLSAVTRNTGQDAAIQAMAERLKRVYIAERSLKANPNIKLLLTDLALTL